MPEVTFQTGTNGDIFDSYLDRSAAATNFGTSVILKAGFESSQLKRAVFRVATGLPVGSIITAATFSFKCSTAASATDPYSLYLILRDGTTYFVEAEVTWNIRETGTNWNSAGCGGSGTDFRALPSLAFNAPTLLGAVLSVDVKRLAQKAMDNNFGNFAIRMKKDDEDTTWFELHSSEAVTVADRPKLVVTYTVPKRLRYRPMRRGTDGFIPT